MATATIEQVHSNGGPPQRRFVIEGETLALCDEALTALATVDARLFIRARRLSRVVRDAGGLKHGIKRPTGAPVIEAIVADTLRHRLARLGMWVKQGKTEREVLPPDWLVRDLMARDGWPLPVLEGVIEAPTMRPDGSILSEPGFDPATGLLLEMSDLYPAIPSHPNREDATVAAAALVAPFGDFPFRAASDTAAAVSALLALVGRCAIRGPVPMYAVRAPTPATGKSLLVDCLSIIATGRESSRMTVDNDDSETRKRILGIALDGTASVLLDNVTGRLGSPSLAAALTAETWKDRLLGVNANAEAPLRCVWMATGNNLEFKGDLGRRVVPIDLDAGTEHPEDREEQSFRHPELRQHVTAIRCGLVMAALTLLRAYHVAGRPKHGLARKGSYEAWDDLVRGACVWVGLGDPDAGKERIRVEDDSDIAALRGALGGLLEAFATRHFSAAEAVQMSETSPALRGALTELLGHDRLSSAALGYAMRAAKNRPVGGLRLIGKADRNGIARWRISGNDDVPPVAPTSDADLFE